MSKIAVAEGLGRPLSTMENETGEFWYYITQGKDKSANYYVRNMEFGPDGNMRKT